MSILCPGHELYPKDCRDQLIWPVAGVQGWHGQSVAQCGVTSQPPGGTAQRGGLMSQVASWLR